LNIFLRLVLVSSFVLFATNVAANSKVGYVKVEKILRESSQAAESAKKIKMEFSHRAEEITQLQKQIEEMEKSGTAKELELDKLKIEFVRKQRELNEDIEIRKNEELAVLQDRINQAVTSVSETEGYDLVFYQDLVYANKRVDLTDKVLKLLDKPTK
jgi:outer membrane protein